MIGPGSELNAELLFASLPLYLDDLVFVAYECSGEIGGLGIVPLWASGLLSEDRD